MQRYVGNADEDGMATRGWFVGRYGSLDLLCLDLRCLDELGYVQIDPRGAELLFRTSKTTAHRKRASQRLSVPLDASEVDAFSLPFADRPVVVLGTDKGDRARSRFDAAHELGHLVIHGESVWGVKEVETQANKFAAEFLMPAAEIAGELPSRADWASLFALKQRWHVSIAALLMRAKDLGVMSPAAYTTAMKGMSARGWRRSEPIQLGDPEGPALTTELLKVARSEAAWFPKLLLPGLAMPIDA